MITKASDLRHTSSSEMRGGKGTVAMTHFLEQADSQGAGRLFVYTVMPPGSSIGKHIHEGEYEVYYILEGVAHVMDNDEPGILEPGDCMICKDGDTHSIENRGDADLKAIFLILHTKE